MATRVSKTKGSRKIMSQFAQGGKGPAGQLTKNQKFHLDKEYLVRKGRKELIDSYDLDMARLEEIDKSLKGPGYALTTADRKKLGLEKKRIKKKWKSPGGGIVKDAQGNIIGDYRTGLEKKVFDLKQRLK